MKLFFPYISEKENLTYLYAAIVVGAIYFIILRILYPVPGFYFDSYTYIQVARDHHPISFRPVEYSRVINFFRAISTSDLALIAAQFFTNLFSNLFLFFTCTFLFPFKKVYKVVFFVLIICDPLYLFYSNYILADSFFSAFTVLWFTLLIWMIYQPGWLLTLMQLLILAVLFKLRYNAMVFPLIAAIAILLSKQNWRAKLLGIASGFLLILLLVITTIHENKLYTGTATFSAFSGWQLANNALHILQYESIDTAEIENGETKQILQYTKAYFDTATISLNPGGITSNYMWDKKSPLKSYLHRFASKQPRRSYLQTWVRLGPVYNEFGKTVILKKPLSYVQYFILTNLKQYFIPDLEAYSDYNQNSDTINSIAKTFYRYESNKIGSKHKGIYAVVFKPWKLLFPLLNILFIILLILYVVLRRCKDERRLFNKVLLCFVAFYLANFFFVVMLAPSVLRYHIFIITLLIPVILLLLQKLSESKSRVGI